ILYFTSEQSYLPSLSTNDGSLFRSDNPGGEYDYEVTSDADPAGTQPQEAPPGRYADLRDDLKEGLRAIAEPLIADIKGDDTTSLVARARAIEAYLRDSGQFGYTLEMKVIDHNVDPVLDFLTNRKEGHCEYFASALALLLRSVDIQARVVNGFKGGDWNELTSTINVRQKHAHSWVEAYIGTYKDGPTRGPVWITLDPTPANARRQSIAQVGGMGSIFRPLTDLIRHVWVFYVVGYNGERQDRLIYQPMLTLIKEAKDKYVSLGLWLRHWFARLFHFR